MTSNDSKMTSVENEEQTVSICLTSIPLWIKLFFLVVATLIPRVIVFFQPHIITNDGVLYIRMARSFAEGNYSGTPGSYFSLYPFLIFLVEKLTGDWELSGQLISIGLGTLTVIPVFLLGRSLYNEKIGWLSSLFYITLPNLLRFDSQVIRDPTLWFFLLWTIWLVWEGEKKNRLFIFSLAGLTASLAALTRVEGFVVWGTLGGYIAASKPKGAPTKQTAAKLISFIIFFPLLVSIILTFFTKHPSATAFGEMSSFSFRFVTAHLRILLQPGDPIERIGEKAYSSLPAISQDALELASRHRFALAFFEVIYKFVKSANFLVIFISWGLWKRRKDGFLRSDKYLFYAFAVLFLMSLLYARQLYYFSTRHGLTLVLPCLFLAAHGVQASVALISSRMRRLGIRWKPLVRCVPHLLVFTLLSLFLVQGLLVRGERKIPIKETGLWLKHNGYRGSVIMAPKKFSRLAFYADGSFVEMPDSWQNAFESIGKHGVKLVAIDSCTIAQDCPGFLENWSRVPLIQVTQTKNGTQNDCAIRIYAVP